MKGSIQETQRPPTHYLQYIALLCSLVVIVNITAKVIILSDFFNQQTYKSTRHKST